MSVTASTTAAAQAMPLARRRALVLAGDDVIREALAHWLETVGYEVAATDDGEAALAFLDHGGAELVVADRVYPGWRGVTLQALRRRLPEARLVVAGIDRDDPWFGLAHSVGADLVLPAPLTRKEVLSRLV